MPLRQLQYIGRTYEKVLDAVALYASSQVKIPTPEFFVIYTGARKWEADTLSLSDSFLGEAPENSVELVVKIIDMGYNGEKDERSQEVLRRSEKLRGYGTLLGYVREYCAQVNDTRAAVDLAIRRCIDEGILKDFLEKTVRRWGVCCSRRSQVKNLRRSGPRRLQRNPTGWVAVKDWNWVAARALKQAARKALQT